MTLVKRLLAVWLMVSFCGGCGVDEDGSKAGGGPGGVSESALVGTWRMTSEYGTETLELKADGTFVWVEDEYDDLEAGTWSVDGTLLSLSVEESGTYEEGASEPEVYDVDGGVDETEEVTEEPVVVSYEETETWIVSVAIVADRLHFDAIHRMVGSGAKLDGTWEWAEGEAEEGTEDDLSYDAVEMEKMSIEISGTAGRIVMTDEGYYQEGEDRETWNVSESLEGTVVTEGDLVKIMGEGSLFDVPAAVYPGPDGGEYEVEEEDENEILYAFRVSPDIMLMYVGSALEAESEAFKRVR